jgi:hypothetical protein
VELHLHSSLTTVLVGQWSGPLAAALTKGESDPITHRMGDWVEPQSRSKCFEGDQIPAPAGEYDSHRLVVQPAP